MENQERLWYYIEVVEAATSINLCQSDDNYKEIFLVLYSSVTMLAISVRAFRLDLFGKVGQNGDNVAKRIGPT